MAIIDKNLLTTKKDSYYKMQQGDNFFVILTKPHMVAEPWKRKATGETGVSNKIKARVYVSHFEGGFGTATEQVNKIIQEEVALPMNLIELINQAEFHGQIEDKYPLNVMCRVTRTGEELETRYASKLEKLAPEKLEEIKLVSQGNL